MTERLSVGRPRSEASKEAIINATTSLLEESGYLPLTIEAIASRAQVSKATIYRWWSNKEMLILESFLLMTDPIVGINATHSLAANITRHLQGLMHVFNSTIGRTMLAIVSGNQADAEVVQAFHKDYLMPRREDGRNILRHAVAKGEIASTLDEDVVLDMIYGPLYYRVLIYKKDLDEAFIRSLIKHAMNTIYSKP